MSTGEAIVEFLLFIVPALLLCVIHDWREEKVH
jgi:hypothetical protein